MAEVPPPVGNGSVEGRECVAGKDEGYGEG